MVHLGAPPPTTHDPAALTRRMDPSARSLLLDDWPDYWEANLNALANLASAPILDHGTFDALVEENKYIIVSRVRHVVEQLSDLYVRHVGTDGPDVWVLRSGGVEEFKDDELIRWPPVFYVREESMWGRLSDLAADPGVSKGIADPACVNLYQFLDQARDSGDLVHGERLEALLRHAPAYFEDPVAAAHRRPQLDLGRLDQDLVHAFLCAYAACFHA